nr:RNA-directed DNA polymerase, eukaryota [Tanacetum cinerariifolium]
MSPINAFSVEELYSPPFSDSFQENIGYCKNPLLMNLRLNKSRPHQRRRRRRRRPVTAKRGQFKAMMHPDKLYRQQRKKLHWLKESGAGDEDYVQRALIHYEVEAGLLFKLRHCREILKDRLKWQEVALLNFATESGSSKRHKSYGSSSFNKESQEASINLNTNVGDNHEDDVQEIRRPGGRDKVRSAGKNKGLKASGSSTVNKDALTRLMVAVMTAREKEQREKFLKIKRRDVECLIKAIQGEEAGLDLKSCNTNGLWAKIAGSINFLHSSGIVSKETLRIKVGCGSHVRFWKDHWICESLCQRYNRLCRLDLQPQCLVRDHFVGGVWSFQWRREVTRHSSDLLARLMDDLNQITRLEGEETFCWNIGSTGLFTVGAIRNHIDDLMLPTMDIQTRWYKILPKKVNIFFWRLKLDRLSHRLNLSRRVGARDLRMLKLDLESANNGYGSPFVKIYAY